MKPFALLGVVLALNVTAAPAQDCAVGITPPPAGSWAEYTSVEGGMRLALLGQESRGAKRLFRIEINLQSRQGPMILQVLVPGYPYELASVEEMVIKPANGPAMRMSAQMMSMMRNQMGRDPIAEACLNSKMTRIGEESVTVPAGTFRAVHYRDGTSGNDVWVSESVPFGLIRATTTGGGEFVLKAKGTGAKSQITETPQEMGMPGT